MKKSIAVSAFSLMMVLVFSAGTRAESGSSIDFSGHIEVELGISKAQPASFGLGEVAVNVDASLADEVAGSVVLRPDAEAEENGAILDEAFVTITKFKPVSIQAGKMVMPFGVFNNRLATDPVTKEWEINEVGAVVGGDLEDYSLSLAGAVYSADVSAAERLINYAGSLNYAPNELLNLTLSVHYGPQAANVKHSNIGANLESIYESFTLDAEYVGGISRGEGEPKPSAAYIGLAWQAMEDLEAAFRYEINKDDDPATDSIENSIVAGLNWAVADEVTLTVEGRRNKMDSSTTDNQGVIKVAYEF